MIFNDSAISVQSYNKDTDTHLLHLIIDLNDSSVNTLGKAVLGQLGEAVDAIEQAINKNRDSDQSIQGLIVSSAKKDFVVGANVHEFTDLFAQSEEEITDALAHVNNLFNRIETLSVPTVCAIDGLALGGGCELSLACDFRVLTDRAKVGLPEVKLGIHPGWGGTVRLPRLIGIDNANEWICGGGNKSAKDALHEGFADAICDGDVLIDTAALILKRAHQGDFDVESLRNEKHKPVHHSPIELMMAFESAMGLVKGKAGPHYPAPVSVLKSMQKSVTKPQDKALIIEAESFAKMAKTDVCRALIHIFQSDTYVKRVAKQYTKNAQQIDLAGVLGAGIMGGGIAYQSASKSTPILMRDIKPNALELGMKEARKLLDKQYQRGKISAGQMAEVISAITPTLSLGDFEHTDIVIEAVVENQKVKQSVLAECESVIKPHTVLASNTSTISINDLASSLAHPERFCGMHFFNPVHKMPLVEIIRGAKTDDQTIATTVSYAQKMGKTPIVVNDCAGFFVNRVLFPYFGAFTKLVQDGADFQHVDKVMEKFGWPMGPAYLLDVVGLDTANHADEVVSKAYPDRMGHSADTPIQRLFQNDRLGQKNNLGFYRYETDKKGRLQKLPESSTYDLLSDMIGDDSELEDQTIIDRMMIPLCLEVVRCLEEGIIASPAEADMALVYGIGFPPHHGGVFHYINSMGLEAFCTLCDQYAELGPLYHVTEDLRAKAKAGEQYDVKH